MNRSVLFAQKCSISHCLKHSDATYGKLYDFRLILVSSCLDGPLQTLTICKLVICYLSFAVFDFCYVVNSRLACIYKETSNLKLGSTSAHFLVFLISSCNYLISFYVLLSTRM